MSDGSVTIDARLALDEIKKDLKNLKSVINSSLPSASKMLDTLGIGFEKLGKTVTSVGKTFTVVTAGIIAGLSSAVSRFDTLNNYPKVLSNLGFSAEEAEKSIRDLSKGIDGLPTALDDAASGVQRLVAKNNDIEKSTQYFLAMNDAIVAGNAPTEQQKSAIEQLTQSYSKGKPDLMEWRTLMMAMPGQLKQVATAMGYVDTDELYQALNKGTISMDTFMDALVELDKNGADGIMSFQEQAKNSCDSIGTAITNVSNRFKKGFATILGSMNEAAKDTAFGSLAGMINNFSDSIKNFLDKIGEAIKGNETFRSFMHEIANALTKLDTKINSLSIEQLDKIVSSIINMVKIAPILLGVGKGLDVVGNGFKGLSGITTTVETAFAGIGSVGNKISSTTNALLNFSKNTDILKSKLSSTISTFSNFSGNILGGLYTMFPKISGNFQYLGDVVKTFSSKMVTNLKTGLSKTAVITSLFAQLVKFNISEPFRQAFPHLSSGIKQISSSFEGFFGKTISKFGNFSKKILSSLIGIAPAILKAFSFGAVLGLIVAGLGLIQGQFGEKIDEIANNMITQGPTIITNLVNGIVTALPNLINQGTQLVQTFLNVIIANLPTILHGGMQIILGLVNGISAALPTLIPQGFIIITQLIQTIVANLPLIIQAGVQMLCTLVNGIAQQLPTLIPMAFEIILTLVDSLLGNIDQLIDTGINLIISLAEGIINALPRLIEKAPIIISKLITAICNNFPKILATGVDLIIKLAVGLIQAIPQLVSKIPQIITAIVNGLKEGMSSIVEVGKNMIEGIWNGIRNAKDWLLDKVKDWCGSVLDGIKGFFGIHSPSTVFRDEVGKFLALGVGEGFEKNIGAVYKKMKASVDFETQKISANISATNDLRTAKGNSQTVTNNNDNGISVNNNFYEKVQSPHETAKATRNAIRRAAYAK